MQEVVLSPFSVFELVLPGQVVTREMKLETLTWFAALVAVTAALQYGSGLEYGRIRARLQNQDYKNGNRDHLGQRRDSNRFDGKADEQARWSGQSAVRDNGRTQNDQALQRRAQAASQNFGRFGNGFEAIAKQIRDEAIRNQYVIKDDAQTQRNNLNSAEGANRANAKKTAVTSENAIDDKINYVYTNKYGKASSESGGFKEENGRNFKKLDLIDEKENDRKLLRGDSAVSRSESDEQSAAKDSLWKSNAAEKQAQQGKYGFADRREDKAQEHNDDLSIAYDRKDSKYAEEEDGKDLAYRLAKDLANQRATYNTEAAATADANRKVHDKKYYGGAETGGNTAGKGDYYPDGAKEAASAVSGDKARKEGSGGAIVTGFGENAVQHEKVNEVAAAKALSSAEALNEYKRNKDKVAYEVLRGLQDNSKGQYKQDLQNAATQGFSGNDAEVAKAAAEWDRNAAAAKSASDLQAKERNLDEALRDRKYYRKIQNDDSETFSRQKQFYHNKKEGGDNNENLKYDRKKNTRNFGAADEAEISKQNQFQNLHQNGKVSSKSRNFEDLVDRRNNLQHQKQGRNGQSSGFDNRDAKDEAQAQSVSNGYERGLEKSNEDDSQSAIFNRQQSLHDDDGTERKTEQDGRQKVKDITADIEYVTPDNGNALGDVRARDFVSSDLLRGEAVQKGPKDYKLPDVEVNIKPIAAVPKVKQPKRERPVPALPPIEQVKSYHAPKYNKPEVDYNTGRATSFGQFQRPSFQRIPKLSLFQGARTSSFNTKQQQSAPKSRFNLNNFGRKAPATSSFKGTLLGGNNFRGLTRSYGR